VGTPTQNDTCCTQGNECLRHTLTVEMIGEGRVVARHGDLECTTGSCAAEYSDIAPVVLTRTDGHVDWTGWEGDCAGTGDVCALTTSADRSVRATYLLGGTVTGALEPAGSAAPLPRDGGQLVARRASTIRVELAGAGYSFAQSGVCACFQAGDRGFLCASPTSAAGTVVATHLASGASRTFEVAFVASSVRPPGALDGVGACVTGSP
jgi:hypothetical protein